MMMMLDDTHHNKHTCLRATAVVAVAVAVVAVVAVVVVVVAVVVVSMDPRGAACFQPGGV